jgi:uncharacterized protein with ParB-like and HNH nuclease domain
LPSIRAIVRQVNDANGDGGGLWLPNIQRSFVWSEDQICRLFDSLMRRYPINVVLFWRTRNEGPFRSFIEEWQDKLLVSGFKRPGNNQKKTLVLDGQQRIQAMVIAIRGSYEGKQLYFDVTSDPTLLDGDNAVAYKFAFKKTANWPWIKVSEIASWSDPVERRKNAFKKAPNKLSDAEESQIERNLSTLYDRLGDDTVLKVNELDSTDKISPDYFSEDDVLEIFIRANSGGTPLAKSDLLFSLLAQSWSKADVEIDKLLEEINDDRYNFERDFVLKLSLVLLGQKAAYRISKFRAKEFRPSMAKNWKQISRAFKEVRDFVQNDTYMNDSKALSSELLLIPFIYLCYSYPTQWKKLLKSDDKVALSHLMARLSLAGTFAGAKDNLIDALVREVDLSRGNLDIRALEAAIQQNNQPIFATEIRVKKASYNSGIVRQIFSIMYPAPNVYMPAFDGNSLSVDHIFPQVQLSKKVDGKPRFSKQQRDTLANLMLLTKSENSSKKDAEPSTWLVGRSEDFYSLHCIPTNPRLWELDNYEEFIEERWKLLLARLHEIGLLER